jgi:hypothetical protein
LPSAVIGRASADAAGDPQPLGSLVSVDLQVESRYQHLIPFTSFSSRLIAHMSAGRRSVRG